ncbi:MAG TPA: MAE_28990/MAE_18760 family HEPN-like nuclease [Rhodanobacter sp.]
MIRTREDLDRAISGDLIWRRRELTDMRALAQGQVSTLRSYVVRRAGIALLYAHWEGFVKKSSHYYLEYVSAQRLKYSELASNFVALAIKGRYEELRHSKKISAANEISEFYCSGLDKPSKVPYKNAVDTASNLSSNVLADILLALGFDVGVFEIKNKFIDVSLVDRRNHVAHGESLSIDLDEYLDFHDEVIALIDMFKTEIDNAIALKKYLRKNQ